MEQKLKQIVWNQLSAAIETMESAIQACPDDVWSKPEKIEWKDRDVVGFWYLAFHSLFFLDYYTTPVDVEFSPPQPFGMEELDPAGLLPDRVYSKEELLVYLQYGLNKAKKMTDEVSDLDAATRRQKLGPIELLIYNARHLQHHAAQMNLILRQRVGSAPDWVSNGKAPFLQTNNS